MSGIPPEEVVSWNKRIPTQHEPTVIRNLYTGFQFFRIGARIWSMTNPLIIAKSVYETLALPAAQLTGSKTAEKCARASVDVLGAATNLPGWAISRTIHYLADTITSQVPTSDKWIFRALKDVVEIAGSEAANYGASNINERINSVREASLKKSQNTEQAISNYKNSQTQQQQLEQKNQDVSSLSTLAQELVNNAQNIARQKGLAGNKEQIALECSRQVNALSITATNPDRNSDTFMTAQAGKTKYHNDNLVARTTELVQAILQENAQALAQAKTEAASSRTNLLDAFGSTTLVDAFFEQESRFTALWQQAILKTPDLKEGDTLDQWIKETYVKNENAAKSASNKKLAIATGMAQDILGLLEQKDTQTKDYLVHTILAAMDDSSRRWYNDVCGKTHELLTGSTTTQFVYKSHGIKKVYKESTKPLKKVAKWLNNHSDQPVTIGAQVNSNGITSATINNIPVFTLYAPQTKTPSALNVSSKKNDLLTKTEVIHLPLTPITDLQFYEELFTEETPNTTEQPNLRTKPRPEPSERPKGKNTVDNSKNQPKKATPVTSKQTKDTKQLNTVNAALTLTHEALKKGVGYSGLGMAGHTISIMTEFGNGYGAAIGSWNVAYQSAVCTNPYTCTAAATTNLYAMYVPQESVDTVVKNITQHSEAFKTQGNLNGSVDLMMQAGLVKSLDLLMRKTNDLFQAPMLTPEKTKSLQATSIEKIDLWRTKGLQAEQKLRQSANACGKSPLEQTQKTLLLSAANGLNLLNEQLGYMLKPKK